MIHIYTAGKQQHDKDTNRRDHKSWDMSIFRPLTAVVWKQHDMMNAFKLLPQANKYTNPRTQLSILSPFLFLFFISVYIISLCLVPWENPSPANCGTSTMWNGIQRHSESQTSAVAFGFSSQREPVVSWVMTVPLSLSDRVTYTLKPFPLLLQRRYRNIPNTQTGVWVLPLQSTTDLY